MEDKKRTRIRNGGEKENTQKEEEEKSVENREER
jgi:hypothetical protein